MSKNLSFPDDFQEYIQKHTRIEIKGGRVRESFLPIWIVKVDNRLFSRSWNKSAKSWFTEFVDTGLGQIKYGETIINVTGKILPPKDPVHGDIDKAYLEKYDQEENLYYSRGITQPEYQNYTMEFFMDNPNNNK